VAGVIDARLCTVEKTAAQDILVDETEKRAGRQDMTDALQCPAPSQEAAKEFRGVSEMQVSL
jgi:hypothetical protein